MFRSTLPGLSEGRLAQLRAMLEEQREFRLDQLTELHRPWPHGPLSTTDPEIFRSLVVGAREALREVQSALWRMDVGRYGRCVACDRPVEMERLEILPQTALCMACHRQAA
jgi:DnaK suppressor protein